jgi:hypothetical protein
LSITQKLSQGTVQESASKQALPLRCQESQSSSRVSTNMFTTSLKPHTSTVHSLLTSLYRFHVLLHRLLCLHLAGNLGE